MKTETTDYNTLVLRQDGTLVALVNDKQITSDSVIIDDGRFEIHGLNKCIIKRGSCKKITPDVIEFTSDDDEVTYIKETKESIFNIQEIINDNREL